MTNQGVRVLDMVVKTTLANTDKIVVVWNAGSNTAQTALVEKTILLKQPIITDPPANNTLTVGQGTILYSNDYIYVAVANNYLKRVALNDF